MGSEDASIYIYNLAGSSPQTNVRGSRFTPGGLLKGAAAVAASAASGPIPASPLVMKAIKGHQSPIGDVAWAFDESRLASGCVVSGGVWKVTLFCACVRIVVAVGFANEARTVLLHKCCAWQRVGHRFDYNPAHTCRAVNCRDAEGFVHVWQRAAV